MIRSRMRRLPGAPVGAQRVFVVPVEVPHDLLEMHRQVEGRPVDGQVIVTRHQHARTGAGRGAKPPGTPNESKNQSVDYRGPPRTGHTRRVPKVPTLTLTRTTSSSGGATERLPCQALDGRDSLVELDQ